MGIVESAVCDKEELTKEKILRKEKYHQWRYNFYDARYPSWIRAAHPDDNMIIVKIYSGFFQT